MSRYHKLQIYLALKWWGRDLLHIGTFFRHPDARYLFTHLEWAKSRKSSLKGR